MIIRRFSSFRAADSGVAAIEFAFILPVMLLLYFGLLDLTGLVSANRKVTTVASAVSDLTAQNRTTVLKAQITDYMNVVNMVMDPMPDSGVTVRVFGYRKAGAAINKIWSTSNGSGPGCSAEPDTAGFTDLMTAGNDLIVAQACMTYSPFVASFLGKSILGATTFDVDQEVIVRPRSTLVLNCNVTAGGALCT